VHQGLPGGNSTRDVKEMKHAAILIMVAALLVGGCSGMSTTTQRTVSGGAIGASGGALIGWAAGCPACGAAIGGGAGLLGGYVYDQYEKSQGRP
jgi:osmotically inducible lipoprotein OsmB